MIKMNKKITEVKSKLVIFSYILRTYLSLIPKSLPT